MQIFSQKNYRVAEASSALKYTLYIQLVSKSAPAKQMPNSSP